MISFEIWLLTGYANIYNKQLISTALSQLTNNQTMNFTKLNEN